MSVLRGTVAGALTMVAVLFLIGGGAFVFLMDGLEEVRLGVYQWVVVVVTLLGALAGGLVGGWQARAGGACSRRRVAISGLVGPLLFHLVSSVAFGSEAFLLGLFVTLLGAAAGAWAASRRAPATA